MAIKARPAYKLSTRGHFKLKDTQRLKVRGWERYSTQIEIKGKPG